MQNVICSCGETVSTCGDWMAQSSLVSSKVSAWTLRGCLNWRCHLHWLQCKCDYLTACWSVRRSRQSVLKTERCSAEQNPGAGSQQKRISHTNYTSTCCGKVGTCFLFPSFLLLSLVFFLWENPEHARFPKRDTTVSVNALRFFPRRELHGGTWGKSLAGTGFRSRPVDFCS